MEAGGILKQGRNCWRIAAAARAAFLVDGEAYFTAVAEAMRRARQTIYIVGWDVDSRIRLIRRGEDVQANLPVTLGAYLNALLVRRPALHIYVLNWDFAMLYALEREPLPRLSFDWNTHPRLRFKLDGKHPVGASHHQKLVVVDDRVAFCGGFDLASCRWDTSDHAPTDPRRRDNGRHCRPFHDVQLLVDGEAARALGDLVRERWRRADDEPILAPKASRHDPWPEGLAPELERAEVGILRTDPACDGREQVCEVRDFYLDAIAAARSSIYIENQYFTAHALGEALARRLAEAQGPEVILVLPRACSGWLEEGTMGVLRARLLRQLRQADRHGRLRAYYPTRDDLDGEEINVHAKVLVVDDWLVRVGSSNLNNRSMGLDSECDLAIDAGDRRQLREGIAAFRNRLLAEHLGTEPAAMAAALARRGRLAAAIESLNGGRRRLAPLAPEVDPWMEEWVPDASIIDPEKPISFNELVEQLAPSVLPPETDSAGGTSRERLLLLLLAAALVLAGLWRCTPLGDWLDAAELARWAEIVRGSPIAPLIVLAAYVLGGLLMVPVTLLILATALVFGSVGGFLYALTGSLLSALASYGIGWKLGRNRVRRMAGPRVNRIHRFLIRRGLLTMTAVRLLPIAPFTLVNLVAGASQLRLRHFLYGTVLGMAPGILAITLFEEGLMHLLAAPGWGAFLQLAAVLALVAGGAWLLRQWLRRQWLRWRGGDDEGGRDGG